MKKNKIKKCIVVAIFVIIFFAVKFIKAKLQVGKLNNLSSSSYLANTYYKDNTIAKVNEISNDMEHMNEINSDNMNNTENCQSYGINNNIKLTNNVENANTSTNNKENNNFSNGVNIEYIDINTNKMISVPEKIYGKLNDPYDLTNFNKQISNYDLISVNGETKGNLKNERINVKYNFAKKEILHVKYLDKENNNEIFKEQIIEGHEQEKKEIDIPIINYYKFVSGEKEYLMQDGENILNIYYEKINQNKELNNNSDNNDKRENVNNKGNNNLSNQENSNNLLNREENSTITIRCVDIDNDNILNIYKISGKKDSKIKVPIKEVEKYKLVSNEFNEDNNQQIKNNINDKKENLQTDKNNRYQDNIIDELISSLSDDDDESGKSINENNNEKMNNNNFNKSDNNKMNNNKNLPDEDTQSLEEDNSNIKSEYEIVMNCDDSDYIIYYKKI